MNSGFVWDDWKLLVNNEVYRSFDFKAIFLTKANGLEYLPVRDLTLLFDLWLWGMKPLGFHLTNLLLYLAGLVVVFSTVRILTEVVREGEGNFIAVWTTLIFALHPLHVEAVNFIAARNNLLAALLLFLSLNACLRGIKARSNILIFLSMLLFIAALFSKASVVFYPFFLAAVFFLFPGAEGSLRKKILVLLVFLTIDVLAVLVHFRNAAETGMMNEGFIRFGADNKVFLFGRAVQVAFFYLKKLVLPYPLTVLYPALSLSVDFTLLALAGAVVLASVLVMIIRWRKRHPLIVLAIVWYFLSLGPVLNIFPTEPVVADRYAYFAVFGFGLLCASVLKTLAAKRRAFLYAACGIIALWGVIDVSRSADWDNDLSLWQSALSTDPDMPTVELANALWAKGRHEEALGHLKKEYDGNRTFRYNQFLGRYLFESGRYGEAIAFFRKALEGGGESSKDIHLSIAAAYEATDNKPQALEHYLRAMEIKDASPMGRSDQSARDGIERTRAFSIPRLNELRKRAANEPGNFEAQASFAIFSHGLGMYKEAEDYYLRSVELNPSSWEAWHNLGLTQTKLGKYAEAVSAYKKSLIVNRQNTNALNNIGICYMAMRDYSRAI
ncbi:MAG TPA: tetratricopeptide repeat protein, partial [Thermodesulfovibrionales bacterium]|nr:tetratricopeptide repeat protein [Thermodesulfovibrionales bacterium]